MKQMFSHVDIRVRDRRRSTAFYNILFNALGVQSPEHGKAFTTYALPGRQDLEWFGITEDASHKPDASRIAFAAESKNEVDRVAALLPEMEAQKIEGPEYAYGSEYYAVFFEDPDGNKLEFCYIGK